MAIWQPCLDARALLGGGRRVLRIGDAAALEGGVRRLALARRVAPLAVGVGEN